MPKLKLSSSSHAASQAKKQKRQRAAERRQRATERRQGPDRAARRQRNTEARRIARLDQETRQEERIRDSVARRQIRQDYPERRQEEQARDTASRQRARQEDPERRQEEQARDTASRQRARQEDPERRQEEQARDTASRRRARQEDPERRQEEQARDTASRRRARQEDPERRQEEQARDTAAHRQVREDPERRQEEQARDTVAHRQVREDPERRQEEQARDTAAHQQVREDPERRQEEQARNTIVHRLARQNSIRRTEEQQRDLQQHREARADPEYRAQQQQVNTARRQQVRAGRQANFRALNYQSDNFVSTTNVGTLSIECQNCGAFKFSKETEGFCCLKGNVKLDAFPQPQPYLQHLYEGTDSGGKHFLSNIRKYNSAFQMTSFGCNEITMSGFNPSFRIQGQVYHLIGSMVPTAGESPKFAQIYFIDNRESEVAARCAIVDGLRSDIVTSINELLINENSYVEVFKLAKEIFEQQDSPTNVKIVINENKRPSGEHSRRYNSPVSDEIAVLMPNDNMSNRDVVLHYRDGGLQRISELHRSYRTWEKFGGVKYWRIG